MFHNRITSLFCSLRWCAVISVNQGRCSHTRSHTKVRCSDHCTAVSLFVSAMHLSHFGTGWLSCHLGTGTRGGSSVATDIGSCILLALVSATIHELLCCAVGGFPGVPLLVLVVCHVAPTTCMCCGLHNGKALCWGTSFRPGLGGLYGVAERTVSSMEWLNTVGVLWQGQATNPLTPNDHYRGRTAPQNSKVAFYIFIQQIEVLNILNMVYTLRFFPLQNAVCFIILTYLVPVLFTFSIQGVLK